MKSRLETPVLTGLYIILFYNNYFQFSKYTVAPLLYEYIDIIITVLNVSIVQTSTGCPISRLKYTVNTVADPEILRRG